MSEIVEFLVQVYPIMHLELSQPCFPIEWGLLGGDDSLTQQLVLKPDKSMQSLPAESLKDRRVLSTWISTSPILIAICCIPLDHSLYCDHALEHVLVLSEASTSPLRIPIRACASVLYSHPNAKNLLVVGTVLGDVYVWKLIRKPGGIYSYIELYYHAGGDGMITTINWFKSEKDKALLLIAGQIDGRINTWVYDESHEKIAQGHSYFIDQLEGAAVLTPILIIETISETSFCLHRRGSGLTFYNINNYTTTKDKRIILSAGQECKGIDPLLEISNLMYVSTSHHEFNNHLMITSKQGDIFAVKINDGVPEQAVYLYRTPHINQNEVVLINKTSLWCVLCLTTEGKLEQYDVKTGARRSVPSSTIQHISGSGDGVLTLTEEGSIETLVVTVE